MSQPEYQSENLQLFPTEVQILRWQTAPGFNERLSTVCKNLFKQKIDGQVGYLDYNLWNEKALEIVELKEMFVKGMGAYLDAHFKPEVKQDHLFTMHSWLRIDRPKTVIPPHNHLGTSLVATYYCQVDISARSENAVGQSFNPYVEGDLIMLDPRPAVRPRLSRAEPVAAISPEVGMMVVMPNYLMHWVNPVSEGDERICIANNLSFNRRKPFGVPVEIERL